MKLLPMNVVLIMLQNIATTATRTIPATLTLDATKLVLLLAMTNLSYMVDASRKYGRIIIKIYLIDIVQNKCKYVYM